MFKKFLIPVAAAFILAYAVPVSAGPVAYGAAVFLGAMILLAVVFMRALIRRDQLVEWIAVELNKLRRIYHLGKNLGAESRHRQWFTELHGHVYGYLTAFDKKNFSQYQETNGDFRKLSYHLYQIPSLDTEKERVLYRDLLEAAGVVAGARQRIQELWSGGLPASTWNALAALNVLAGAAVLFSMGPADRLVTALLLSFSGAAMMLVRETDGMRSLAGNALTKRYVENIARLELRRHE